MTERRKLDRREFSQYMRMMDEQTGELVGHLADISTGGFKLLSNHTITPNVEFLLHMDLMAGMADKDHIVFVARSKWCQKDQFDPRLFNVGFQIVEMKPEDLEIFIRLFEKFGEQRGVLKDGKSKSDYLWR
jgi:hypothetical protein